MMGGRLSWERITVKDGVVVYGTVGSGPPVLFLHGWGLGYRSYRRSLEHIAARGVRVYAPALPGFGGTPALVGEDCSIAGYARWTAEFLDAVGIEDPIALVGHSFGGGVAIELANQEPARVRHLVLVNSIGGSAWTRGKSALRSLAERPLWDWGLHMSLDLLPLRQFTRVVPVILEDALPNMLRDPASILRVAGLARTADLTGELEELNRRGLPIVVLWGKADRVLPQASMESLCAAAGVSMDQCLTVEGTHTWVLTDPEALGEVMTNVAAIGHLREPVGNHDSQGVG